MKTILITNRKGGVGKTTTAVNLSAILGVMGKKVLVIDLDTQSHAQYGLGFLIPFKQGIHKALYKNKKLTKLVQKTEFENVSLIPANINYNVNKIKKATILKKLIEQTNFENEFDFCIIDTPPTSDILLANALSVSKYAIVPFKTEYLGAIGVGQFLSIFYNVASRINPELELLGVLPTMYNKSMKEHDDIIAIVKQKIGEQRVLNPIRNDAKISNAFLEAKPVNYLDNRTRGSVDYRNLTVEILNKTGWMRTN